MSFQKFEDPTETTAVEAGTVRLEGLFKQSMKETNFPFGSIKFSKTESIPLNTPKILVNTSLKGYSQKGRVICCGWEWNLRGKRENLK